MIYLALAVGCSLTIGMIFKHTGRAGIHRLELLTVNYLAATVLSLMVLVYEGRTEALGMTPGLAVLGLTTGALFICGFFLLSLATDLAGMGLAIGVMRVSVVIPFLASWWIWGETPSVAQGWGLVVAAAAFFLIAGRRAPARRIPGIDKAPKVRPFLVLGVLALVFLVGGVIDTLLKTFEEVYSAGSSRAGFLTVVFAVAFVLGAALRSPGYLVRGERPDRRAIVWGVLLGTVNYGSAGFLLAAISRLSGPFVFPANNIAIVIGAAVLGVVFWHERLTRLNVIGLFLATLALILLNF
jgi:drug/metabolite transporter (DMT)-like permease